MDREKQIAEATLNQKEEAEMKSGGQPSWVGEQAVGEMKGVGWGWERGQLEMRSLNKRMERRVCWEGLGSEEKRSKFPGEQI